MPTISTLIAFGLVAAALLAPASRAAPVIDQEQPVIDTTAPFVIAIGGGSEQKLAQVITPARTGLLTEVRFSAACVTDLRVEVQGVANDVPNGAVLGSQTLPFPVPFPTTFRSVPFSHPVPVTSGVPYALILTSPVSCGIRPGPVGNPYPGGDAFFDSRPNPRGVWVPLSLGNGRLDLPFQTLVDAQPLEVTPDTISVRLTEGDVTSASFSVRNTSDRSLDLTLREAPDDCDAPSEVSWLAVPTDTVTTAARATADIGISLDASSLTAPDKHSAKVCIELEGDTVLEVPVAVQVQYPFSGFLATFANPPMLNDAHSDGVQTFWFRLGGDRGLDVVLDASSRQINCATGEATGGLEPARTPSWDSLFYQASTGRYGYPWRTTTALKSTCREFVLTLSDASVHTAWLRFVK